MNDKPKKKYYTRVDIYDLLHPCYFPNPDTLIPGETLTPRMPRIPRYRSNWNMQNDDTPSNTSKSEEETTEIEIPTQNQANNKKADTSVASAGKGGHDGWIVVAKPPEEKIPALEKRPGQTTPNNENALVAKPSNGSLEPIPFLAGDTFLKEIDDWELDVVEERMMDVYFEEVDTFMKVKF